MRKLLLSFCFFGLASVSALAQTLEITMPSGLTDPYEVAAGTAVTISARMSNPPTAFFSFTEAPVFPDFGKDDAWTQHDNFIDNGDGTYGLDLTVNEPVFIWAGTFSSWIGQWQFSEVLEIGISSGVKIQATDGLLCPGVANTESLSVDGSYATYQWYLNGEAISGATNSTLSAATPGKYKVQVPLNNQLVFSNTLTIKEASIFITGGLNGSNQLVLSAPLGFASYQWLKGTTENNLPPASSATADTYTVALTAQPVYYAIRGTIAGCTVQSEVRAASTGIFTKPVITLDVEANSFGKICKGTEATLSVPAAYSSYVWYSNGIEYFGADNTTSVYEETGPFVVKVTPVGWAEISISSNPVTVPYFNVIEPQLSGVENYSTHCPGETLNIVLDDEGYTYHWYVHSDFEYTAEDEVTVSGATYSLPFQGATYVSVVANFLGCESNSRLYFDSYQNGTLFLNIDDNEQEYLCPGKSVVLSLLDIDAQAYQNFQWYKMEGENAVIINGQTSGSYSANTPGKYFVKARPKACATAEVTSLLREIYDYSQRELYVYADKTGLCEGEEATLSISGDWENIQWFKKDIVITSTGYENTYTPLANAGTTSTQVVSTYNSYLVKAKHKSCPAGLKTTSLPIQIAPAINPDITIDPAQEIYAWHKGPYDSIASYIYCVDAPVKLHLEGEFESITWYRNGYTGDGGYALGNQIANATNNNVDVVAVGAEWFTAKVVANGCTGFSDPIIIDTWVHNSPAVEVFNNGEICGENGSTLLRLAFYGDWVKYEWYKDGELVPDSDDDSLFVTTPGGYTIMGYPSACPHIGYSSGVPVDVRMFPKATIEENDDVLYAMPEEGFYTYQWYRDGEPIEAEETPWVLHKANLPSGVYTVEVTNPEPCSSISDGFVWTIMGAEEEVFSAFTLHPNPTTGKFEISGLQESSVRRLSVYSAQGLSLYTHNAASLAVPDLSGYAPGVYIVEVILNDGARGKRKLLIAD